MIRLFRGTMWRIVGAIIIIIIIGIIIISSGRMPGEGISPILKMGKFMIIIRKFYNNCQK